MDTAPLAGWENFYVIIGSAGGGLTGLTFVVIALIRDAQPVNLSGLRAFVTPTIVHFAGVLALGAFMSMPHQGALSLSVGLGLGGLAGLIYSAYSAVMAANLLRRSSAYVPVREDWIFNVILPALGYALLVAMAVLIWERPGPALYGVAAVSLLLLFVGIHNAWDMAVWMTLNKRQAG